MKVEFEGLKGFRVWDYGVDGSGCFGWVWAEKRNEILHCGLLVTSPLLKRLVNSHQWLKQAASLYWRTIFFCRAGCSRSIDSVSLES